MSFPSDYFTIIPPDALPHTTNYILYDDTEKLGKFVNIMQDEATHRKKLYAEKRVQNFADGPEPFDLAAGLEVESVTRAESTRMQSSFVIIGTSGKCRTNMRKVLLNQISGSGTIYLFDSSTIGL